MIFIEIGNKRNRSLFISGSLHLRSDFIIREYDYDIESESIMPVITYIIYAFTLSRSNNEFDTVITYC
jgi:hypothetical protein